jgi:hypothetical protein
LAKIENKGEMKMNANVTYMMSFLEGVGSCKHFNEEEVTIDATYDDEGFDLFIEDDNKSLNACYVNGKIYVYDETKRIGPMKFQIAEFDFDVETWEIRLFNLFEAM